MSQPSVTPTPAEPEALAAAFERGAALALAFLYGREHPVQPAVTASELTRRFADTLAERGIGLSAALAEVEAQVLPHSMAMSSPMYFGLLNCSPLPAAVLGDLLVSAVNNNAGAFHQAPAAFAAEREVIRAFAALIDAEAGFEGMLLPGGTFANLQGLVLARDAARDAAPVGARRLYVSEAGHFSVERSARVAGFTTEEIVAVPVVGRGVLDAQALRTRIARDREQGATPVAVVGTAGTTVTGAIDPLDELARICEEQELWLHVDACYGGAALLVEELRPRLLPLARADSVALDPHKWFFCPLTASLLLLRRPQAELPSFDVDVSYIPRGATTQGADAWRRGIPTSRRSSSLAVWLALRAHGFAAVREAVRRNIQLSRELERRLEERGFDVLGDGELSIACARWVPEGLPPTGSDALQDLIAASVRDSGRAWFATVHHGGRNWLCFRSTNLHTRLEHVERLVELVHGAALRCAAEAEGAS